MGRTREGKEIEGSRKEGDENSGKEMGREFDWNT